MKRGKIYLVPNVIANNTQHKAIAPQVSQVLAGIKFFLAEDIRTARRYFSSLKVFDSIEKLNFEVLNKDTQPSELSELFIPVFEGFSMGIVSESGCPGIADPGAMAAKYAHENGIQVVPLVGPSSILMALMASGLNGQCFAFQGYLPIRTKEASLSIRTYEKESRKRNQTQIFIETPYRSDALFKLLLKTLEDSTHLCIACDIMGESEDILTVSVGQWKMMSKQIPKVPVVFLFLSV